MSRETTLRRKRQSPTRHLGVPHRAPSLLQLKSQGERGEQSNGPVRIRPNVEAELWNRVLTTVLTASPGSLRDELIRMADSLQQEDLRIAAVCMLIADLDLQGWAFKSLEGALWALPPEATSSNGESSEAVKGRLRQRLQAARNIQLVDPAVRAFLDRAESRRLWQGRRVSVLDLVDDGHELSGLLLDVSRLPPSEREAALAKVVRPSLQVVDSSTVCQITGLPLIDVWRYFRHTWSLEYRPTPGRSLYFLIRNAARPNQPVMAIGALANATLQVSARERWIGWSASALHARIRNDPGCWPELRAALLRTLDEEIGRIKRDDLLATVGEVDGEELELRLLALAAESRQRRHADLQNRHAQLLSEESVSTLRRLPTKHDGTIDWEMAAKSYLFTAKRAKTLADLLFAKRILTRIPNSIEVCEQLTEDEASRRAFVVAAREIRKVGLASRLLELNVCGAVPPYGPLLAGKLAALAAACREIRVAYAERYSGKASEIASQMAGREVVRPADLCVIGTTSLYGVAASQYNRLKITLDDPGRAERIEWCDLGLTKGYGTVQFGERTISLLREISTRSRGARRVNNLFGEGQSPRLRQVREALEDLGLDSDRLLQHSTPRRVYAMELFPGAREALCLNSSTEMRAPDFESIACAWRARWLQKRLSFRPALERVAEEGPEGLSAMLRPAAAPQAILFERVSKREAPRGLVQGRTLMPMTSDPELIQSLYKATGSCADHHDPATVRLLHIETSVDDYIRRWSRGGKVLFVTGNPGDGKTHLLRSLEADLRAAKIDLHLDANEEDDVALIRRINAAAEGRGRAIAVAINEGVLVSLLKQAEDRSWAKSARDLLFHPFIYRDGEKTKSPPSVCVLDLTLRNNLAPEIVRKALARLIELSGPCEGCPLSGCSLQMNAQRLANENTVARLLALLTRVSASGLHATMRDVQGFLSYLMMGGKNCEEFKRADRVDPYWLNAFSEGQGDLFNALRGLDPYHSTVPFLDNQLWRSDSSSGEWCQTAPPGALPKETLQGALEAFASIKRRALFEHAKGEAILGASETVLERTMGEVLQAGRRGVTAIVRLLNHFFDRDESQSDLLYLWTSHRYDARAKRYAAASNSVPAQQLELLVPSLRPEIADAFPDYRAAFGVLTLKDGDPRDGLRVDRPLVQALLAAELGLPATFRRGEPEARIEAFYDRLTKACVTARDDVVEIRLVDLDTGVNHRIGVDVTNRVFLNT